MTAGLPSSKIGAATQPTEEFTMALEDAEGFFVEILATPIDEIAFFPVSPGKYVDIMYDWNELFRPNVGAIRALTYCADFETEADEAIRRLRHAEPKQAWKDCTPGCWRVLLERHEQLLVVALANRAAGEEVFTYLPLGLTETQQQSALALLRLLEVKLPRQPRKPQEAGWLAMFPPGESARH